MAFNQILNKEPEIIQEGKPTLRKLLRDPEVLAQELAMERVSTLDDKIREYFSELKDRQKQVRKFHKLLQSINATVDSKERLDWTEKEELRAQLFEAYIMGVDIPRAGDLFPPSTIEYTLDDIAQLMEKVNEQMEALHAGSDPEAVRKIRDLEQLLAQLEDIEGPVDWNRKSELRVSLMRAHAAGVDITDYRKIVPKTTLAFDSDEKHRVVENIKMQVEDLSLQNDMQLQTINKFTNERYEAYQLARTIMRPTHEAKREMARNFVSRR